MADLMQGWNAYHQGNYQGAATSFGGSSEVSAVAGLALSVLAMGRGPEATTTVEREANRRSTPEMRALLADIKGRQGARAEAEGILAGLVSQQRSAGFFRSLLGEQRIRQGKWEAGTEDFIAAMNDRDERTFPHVQQVVSDMVDAVAARRIPSQDAMRFVNRIDYSISKKSQAMNSFFATARRSINGNRRMDRANIPEPWSLSPRQGQAASGGPAPSAARQPPPAAARQPRRSAPPQQSPPVQNTQPQAQSGPAPLTSNQRRRPQRSSAKARHNDMQARLAERPAHMQLSTRPTMQARQKNMSVVLREERQQNERLQDLVATTVPSTWPSEHKVSLDTIAAIGFSAEPILRGSRSVAADNFRITGGDIGAQITLERCMHNLMIAANHVKPVTVLPIPASIPRLELNLLDGFLEKMPPLEDLYQEESKVDDPRPLAMGKFIGQCIVQCYGAVWDYNEPPEESIVHLGDHRLDPMGLAQEFLDSNDFDSVCLRDLVAQADVAVRTSTALPIFTTYLDPTSGLENEALAMSLAELWVNYRFALPDTEVPRVAASIEIVIDQMDTFIPFLVGADFVPSVISEHIDGARDSENRVGLAYVRENGEFLLLASRKHFEQMLHFSSIDLTRENARKFTLLTQSFFRPGWTVMMDQATAQSWGNHLNTSDLKAPQFREQRGEAHLRLSAVDERQNIKQIDIGYRADRLRPYSIRIS